MTRSAVVNINDPQLLYELQEAIACQCTRLVVSYYNKYRVINKIRDNHQRFAQLLDNLFKQFEYIIVEYDKQK